MAFLRNRSNRLRLSGYAVLTAAVAIVLTFGLLSIFRPASASNSVARTVTVETGTVASSVSASGNISPSRSDTVNFQTGGTLTAVDVAVGDKVKAGQVLAKIDPTDADDALKEAEDSVQVAETALADAEAGGTSAQLEQDKAGLASSQLQLTSDREQLSTDQTALSDAEVALTSDEALGCPASTSQSSSSSGGNSSGGNSSGGNSSGGSSTDTQNTTSNVGSPSTTTTEAHAKPTVTTGSASDLATSTVTLNATVDPGGLSTSYKFEYGRTDSYGSEAASATVTGSTSQPVSASVSGLEPDTAYIFRIVATNSLGSVTGLGVAFSTAQSSCVTDLQTIVSDQQTVARDEGSVSAQEESIAATEAGQAPVSSTVLQQESQLLSDQQTVTADQKAVAETTLVAPISGTVTAVDDQVGDSVSGGGSSASSSSSSTGGSGSSSSGSGGSGTGASASSSSDSSSSSSAFITIDDLASLQVVSGFAEADATSIAVGQGATATLAALPDTEVAGRVVAVAPTPTVVSNVVTYDVTIALVNPPETVKDGMTADVSIIVDIARNVLELPNAAITTVGSTSTVQLVQGSTTVTRAVTIGLVGESETQITSGLVVGDKVHEAAATSTGATGSSNSTGGGFGGLGGFGGGGGAGAGGFGGG